eukprot:3129893-Prymnesium_polylepis.1
MRGTWPSAFGAFSTPGLAILRAMFTIAALSLSIALNSSLAAAVAANSSRQAFRIFSVVARLGHVSV